MFWPTFIAYADFEKRNGSWSFCRILKVSFGPQLRRNATIIMSNSLMTCKKMLAMKIILSYLVSLFRLSHIYQILDIMLRKFKQWIFYQSDVLWFIFTYNAVPLCDRSQDLRHAIPSTYFLQSIKIICKHLFRIRLQILARHLLKIIQQKMNRLQLSFFFNHRMMSAHL